jgi:lysine decarboxylase/arginine decarboxylase
MIQSGSKRVSLRALVVDDELTAPTAEGRAARALVQELQTRGIEVVESLSADDGLSWTGRWTMTRNT